jgi:hypothetical protein
VGSVRARGCALRAHFVQPVRTFRWLRALSRLDRITPLVNNDQMGIKAIAVDEDGVHHLVIGLNRYGVIADAVGNRFAYEDLVRRSRLYYCNGSRTGFRQT